MSWSGLIRGSFLQIRKMPNLTPFSAQLCRRFSSLQDYSFNITLLCLNFVWLVVFPSSQSSLFSGVSGSPLFDVWDLEDFIFKLALGGESITCLDLWTFLWKKNHLSLISELPSFPGCDSKRASRFPNIWMSHSSFLCSFNLLVKNILCERM